MKIRVVVSLASALILFVLASTTPPGLAAQETSKAPGSATGDEVDRILEGKGRNDQQFIEQINSIVNKLSSENEKIIHELIDVRAKLRKAVEGMQKLDPARRPKAYALEPNETGTMLHPKAHVLRSVPRPKDSRERETILRKLEAERAAVHDQYEELSYMIQYIKNINTNK
jgi:hypothetical protein